jgi:hypothetical protein
MLTVLWLYKMHGFKQMPKPNVTKFVQKTVKAKTGLWGPEGSGRLRLPDSMTLALEGGILSLPPGVSWYSF